MSNSSTLPSKRSATLRTVAISLGAVVVIEALLHLLPEGQMTNTVRFRLAEIATLPAPDVQVMGDSAAARLPASVIEAQLESRATSVANYALNGTSPYFTPFVLERQIASGRAPKAILYAPHPATLASPMLDRFFGRFATVQEAKFALQQGVPVSDAIFGALGKASYTLRYREELHEVVTAGRFDFFRTARQPVPSVQLSRAVRLLPIPDPPRAWRASELSPQLTRPLFVHPLNAAAIEQFCRLAASQDIRIYWVSLPLPQVLDPEGSTAEREYRAFLDGLAASHPNVTLLHPQIDVLPDGNFRDPWHLSEYAAWQFAQKIGQEFAHTQAGDGK